MLAAASGTALLLTRPLLHTREARAAFAPIAHRRWLLGGSIALSAAGFITAAVAAAASSVGVAALAASFFASAIAVVRMRAWGVFLGTATSLGLVVAGLFSLSSPASVGLLLAAAPALLGHLVPVLVARHRGVGERQEAAAEPAPYRVATEAVLLPDALMADEEEPARAVARA
jgi:hypothetical protein